MTKEEQQLEKHFLDLARMAYQREIMTFSDFLNLNERNILQSIGQKLSYVQVEGWGGYELAERQIAVFDLRLLYFVQTIPSCVLR